MREIMPYYCEYVNPARAGMILWPSLIRAVKVSKPRASGDDPTNVGAVN